MEGMPPVDKPEAAEQSAPKGESAKASAKPGVESAFGQFEAVTVEVSKGASVETEATEVADGTTAADPAPKTAGQQTAAAQSAGLQGQAPTEAQVVQHDQAVSAKGQAKGDTDTVDSVQQVQSESGTKPSTTHTAKSEPAAGANQERLIARIASAVTEAESSGRSVVRLRLYPPELGTVRIEVSSVRGIVSARIEASTQTTQGMLQSNLNTLRADLREAGVDVRDMRVEFRDPSLAFGAQDRSTHRGGHEEERQSRRPRAGREAERVEAVGAVAQEAGVAGLNLYI
jgi:flagellar hook-length control protein FliK